MMIAMRLCLTLMFQDLDYDGYINYLVQQKNTGTERQYLVAFNSKTDVNWRDGCYQVEADCDMDTKALDPPMPGDSSWGYVRSMPICNATKITGDGFLWDEKLSGRDWSKPPEPSKQSAPK